MSSTMKEITQDNADRRERVPKVPVLGAGDAIGAGDSYLALDVVPKNVAETVFEKLKEEVQWHTMHHQGGDVPRLVAVEGEVAEDGSFPIYRHPADKTPPLLPFSPTVSLIREHVEKSLKHPVNHVLIQFYRTGADHISEHSDKTIDIVRGSNIVNVSIGAQRTMTLKMKRATTKEEREKEKATSNAQPPPRISQRIHLPHNSMFVMGPETNKKWLHGIHHDKRPITQKSPEEQYQSGERISLTFRNIGTYMSKDERKIWGQGATGKKREDAGEVINGGPQVGDLIWAFGRENWECDFDWDRWYGKGFDVVNYTSDVDEEIITASE